MFRSSMRSSSGSSLFTSLSMLLILKTIKIFKKYYQPNVVVWQHMFSVPVMRTVRRRELDSRVKGYANEIKFENHCLRNNKTSVCPSAWSNSAPTGRIFHEIWYLKIIRKSFEKIRVSLKSDKNNGHFTWRPIYSFDLVS